MINNILKYLKKLSKRGFTLVEVLFAAAIVGIIAALVLPAVVTKMQSKLFEYKAVRQMDAIRAVIKGLVVTENVGKYTDTMMYAADGTYSVDGKPGKFLKKYFRIAKYCGAPNGDGVSDCFANEYFEYLDKDKKAVGLKGLNLSGACAQLKNGTSLCITPQLPGNNAIQVTIDVNGPKGPNILNRDMFLASSELTSMKLVDLAGSTPDRDSDNAIFAENQPPIVPDPDDPCASAGDWSNVCCQYRLEQNSIKNPDDVCCGNVNVAGSVPACFKEANIHVNYYPTGGKPYSSPTTPTKPYFSADSNTYIDPPSLRIPSGLTIKIKCANGFYGPTISSTVLQEAIDKKKGKYYFSGTVSNKSCFYPNETLLWDANNSKTIVINGLTYHLYQH